MFPKSYFPDAYFPGDYFPPEVAGAPPPATPPVGGGDHIAPMLFSGGMADHKVQRRRQMPIWMRNWESWGRRW